MDWRTHRDLATGRLPLPAEYLPVWRRPVEINREAGLAAWAWLDENLLPEFWEDRPDWVWWFEFAACDTRVALARAEEQGSDDVQFWLYVQLGLRSQLRRRAENLGVDVKELVDRYVRFHRAIGIWEPELLILGAAWRPR